MDKKLKEELDWRAMPYGILTTILLCPGVLLQTFPTDSIPLAVEYLSLVSGAMVFVVGSLHQVVIILRFEGDKGSKPIGVGAQSGTTLKDITANILFGIFCLAVGFGSIWLVKPMMLDLPLIMLGRYEVVEGVLTDCVFHTTDTRGPDTYITKLYIRNESGVETRIEYNGKRYDFKEFEGQKMRLTYLPYTHWGVKQEVLSSTVTE
ncbi:MAG: hypothetical protein IBX64_09510 [Actinobacteria bacterium]|nr:hypothetical protein [Actinomycetota bacterium]